MKRRVVDAHESASYTYDGLDRQRTRTSGLTTTNLFYDGWTPTVVGEGASTLIVLNSELDYGLDAGGRPTALSQANAPQQLSTDGARNVSTVTNAGGSPTCTARFDPFGEPNPTRTQACATTSGVSAAEPDRSV